MAEPEHDPSWRPGRRHASSLGRRRRYLFLAVGLGIGTMVGLLLALAIDVQSRAPQPAEPRVLLVTPYHAVRLSTGQMIVGRLDRLAAPFMVVSEAYTLQPEVTAGGKEPTWSVVSRSEDGPAPGVVIVGAQQVVSIEAVQPGSRLSAMLDEVRAKK